MNLDRIDTRRNRALARSSIVGALLFSLALVAGCGDDGNDEVTPTTEATSSANPTSTPSEPAALPPPTDVVLTGPLPDTNATVAPGEGETGRVTVGWAYAGEADGFRIYQEDCDGEMSGEPIEVGADERVFGPLQPCRPGGRVGVAAYDASGESEIVWAEPEATS
jgi:hypothetical protein